ncbi:MAG TPA: hypothetical protein VGB30_09380 [bacterium]|jgi:hypothetical protein
MNRWTALFAIVIVFFAISCSSGGNTPVIPDNTGTNLTGNSAVETTGSDQGNYLWGYYSVYIDVENQTVEYVAKRTTMFNANVVTFLNGNPAALQFDINDTPVGPDYIDVDIDVTIVHPIPGLTQYNGYDVMGVFIGDGSGSVNGLATPANGTDQYLFNADGYTRWFNPSEFGGELPLMSFTDGIFASKEYSGSSVVNPYKYFADGLGASDDLWSFLTSTSDNGVFASGSSNTRNYLLRFPNSAGVLYDYTVVASWQGEDPADHPANTTEAVAISTTQTPDVFYVPDGSDQGGSLILDIDVFGWEIQPTSLAIESTVFSGQQEFDAGTVVTGGNDQFSTYHVEIAEDGSTTSNYGNEFWVILKYDGYDYTNEFGVSNSASAPLAGYFRSDMEVLTEQPCPETIYFSSFEAGAESSEWTTAAPYWACDFFGGAINSKSAGCLCYDYPASTHYAYRTNGFTVPECWDDSGGITLRINHQVSQESGWDTARLIISSSPGPNFFGTQLYNFTSGFFQGDTFINLTSQGVTPGDTFYLTFFHGGDDSLFNCNFNGGGDGWTIYEMEIN